MSGVYIRNMEMPTTYPVCIVIDAAGQVRKYDLKKDKYADTELFEAVNVPDHGRLLTVLKTERECVSRDCDRDCGKCDLALDRADVLAVYDALIRMFSFGEAPDAET